MSVTAKSKIRKLTIFASHSNVPPAFYVYAYALLCQNFDSVELYNFVLCTLHLGQL